MTRLREAFIDAVTAAIVRAFVWLLRGQELPPLKVDDRTTFGEALKSRPLTSRRCNEFQLLVLFRIDGTLAYALRTSPEPGHVIDTRFRQ